MIGACVLCVLCVLCILNFLSAKNHHQNIAKIEALLQLWAVCILNFLSEIENVAGICCTDSETQTLENSNSRETLFKAVFFYALLSKKMSANILVFFTNQYHTLFDSSPLTTVNYIVFSHV